MWPEYKFCLTVRRAIMATISYRGGCCTSVVVLPGSWLMCSIFTSLNLTWKVGSYPSIAPRL